MNNNWLGVRREAYDLSNNIIVVVLLIENDTTNGSGPTQLPSLHEKLHARP